MAETSAVAPSAGLIVVLVVVVAAVVVVAWVVVVAGPAVVVVVSSAGASSLPDEHVASTSESAITAVRFLSGRIGTPSSARRSRLRVRVPVPARAHILIRHRFRDLSVLGRPLPPPGGSSVELFGSERRPLRPAGRRRRRSLGVMRSMLSMTT
jgi:hypothetical protein